jgi:Trk K+ transport system NAD-binding subunit
MAAHVIVCGLNSIGYKIFCLLRQQNALVVGINDQSLPDEPELTIGDQRLPETLFRAGIQSAHTLIITNNDDAINLDIVMQARLLNPQIRIISHLFNTNLGERLDQTIPEHTTMSVADIAAPIFVFAAMGNRAIGQLHLVQQTWPIYEEFIHAQHPWYQLSLQEIWDDRTRMLISYLTAEQEFNLVRAVSQKHQLQVGDRLIVGTLPLARVPETTWFRQFQQAINDRIERFGQQFRRLQQHGRSTPIAILVLLVTILIVTLTYTHLRSGKASIIDALYFSVGIITGVGGSEWMAQYASTITKVVTAIMMIVGAGVLGMCYALLNDLVLGSRFRQFWDVALIPKSNHYIICGLGGIGVRIATQLHAQGHEVVVIERDSQSRFLGMVRAQNIPVIVGDGTLSETLHSANLVQAAAFLTVASDDMINLEIALTAKNIAPKLPVVVRSQNPEQAQRMQQVFDFAAVLSPPELAAPAFAAAALGGKVFGSGMIGNSLWMAVSLLVTPAHPFCDRLIQEVAISTDLVPLYLETQGQTIHGEQLLKAKLQPQDILHLTIAATDLDQLWHIEKTVPKLFQDR